jgi:hypothetical protein
LDEDTAKLLYAELVELTARGNQSLGGDPAVRIASAYVEVVALL